MLMRPTHQACWIAPPRGVDEVAKGQRRCCDAMIGTMLLMKQAKRKAVSVLTAYGSDTMMAAEVTLQTQMRP